MTDQPAQRPPSSTAAKRHAHTQSTSASAPGPKPPLTADPTAIISDKATVVGSYPVSVGAHAIIHPYARIDSSVGAVSIGEGCVVWERAEVGSADGGLDTQEHTRSADTQEDDSTAETATELAAFVAVSPHARVAHGTQVGTYTTLDVGASVASNCRIGAWCKLAALVQIETGTTLDEFTVVYFVEGEQRYRVNASARDFERVQALEAKGRAKERETLSRILGGPEKVAGGAARGK